MKTKIFLLATAALLLVPLSSCGFAHEKGNGHVVYRQYDISDYNALNIGARNGTLKIRGCCIKLNYVKDDSVKPYLKIECDKNILDRFVVSVNDSTLDISQANNAIALFPTRFVITTNSKELKSLKIAGFYDAHLSGTLTPDNMEFALVGKGIVDVDSLVTENLDCNIIGNVEILLHGSASSVDFNNVGGSAVRAFNFVADKLDAKTVGGNRIEMTVMKSINAKIIGGGLIDYKGTANEIIQKIIGGGFVKHVDDSIAAVNSKDSIAVEKK